MNGTARIAGLAVFLVAGVALAGEPIDQRVDAAKDGRVEIENLAGSVTVTGWNEDRVEVTGELGRDAKELIVAREGDVVEVRVEMPRRVRGDVEDTDLIVKVPKASRVSVETVSASIEVRDVSGALRLESVSGSIEVGGEPGSLEADSVSGSIEVDGKIADVSVESVSGSIELRGTEGRASANSTSGEITILGGNFRRVDCESVSGRVRFDGTPSKDGDFRFESLSGSIELRLPSDLSAEIDVETFSGSIDSDFEGRVRREKYGPGASLSTTQGDGDARIGIETFSGSVRLVRK